jgi:hypothetical protein
MPIIFVAVAFLNGVFVISTAERQLEVAQQTPGHPLELLRLVASSDMADAAVRQAAAVHLKNVIKNGWDPDREVRRTFPINVLRTLL